MKIYQLIILTLLLNSCSYVIFTASEPDAKIYVDGKEMGSGATQTIQIDKGDCVQVKVEKVGFVSQNFSYCPTTIGMVVKTETINLTKDDAYDASVVTDYANKDFEQEVNKKFSEEEAWKLISQIITSYFDNIELADKSTGYMKTSWQSKVFNTKIVRTRIILKQSSSDPLKYKMKIVSEYCPDPNESVKNDEKFREWDRILRSYEGLIPEFQTRIGGN